MSRPFPPRPNLRNFKNQAKTLLKAQQAGDAAAIQRIKEYLPRLSGAEEVEIRAADISLQEVQHVIAREYGLKNWDVLQAVVTPDFGLLQYLDDRGAQILLQEAYHWDIYNGLRGADSNLLERLLSNVSARKRARIEEEIVFPRDVSDEDIKAARQHLMLQVAQCEADGRLNWPSKEDVSPTPDQRKSPQYSSRLRQLAGQPLEELGFEEFTEFWIEAARQNHAAGPLSFEKLCDQIASPLIREGFLLVIDGTEPDLVTDLLETRLQMVLYPREDTRRKLTIEGAAAIKSSDHPNVVDHKIGTFYLSGTEPRRNKDFSATTLEGLQASLQTTPFSQMTYEQISDLFTGMAFLARHQGLETLAPLIEVAEDPLLKRSLELMVSRIDYREMIDILQTQMKAELEEIRTRYELVVEGFAALQEGKGPEEMGKVLREYK